MKKLCVVMGLLVILGCVSLAVGECASSEVVYRCRSCGSVVTIKGPFAESMGPSSSGCSRSRSGQHDYVRVK